MSAEEVFWLAESKNFKVENVLKLNLILALKAVLKNYEPELSYILAKLFEMSLKKFCFLFRLLGSLICGSCI